MDLWNQESCSQLSCWNKSVKPDIKYDLVWANSGGGHWPRKGVQGCAALKTPFSRLSCSSQGSHFKQMSQFTSPPFEKFWILASTASIFPQNLAHKPPNLETFSSQTPKFGNSPFTSPQIWEFSVHKPPFSEASISSQVPHFGSLGRTPLPEKKLSAPPPRADW